MKKIVSLFVRDFDRGATARDEIMPGAEWVANGEGVATRKRDGTCCLVEGGILFKRYDAKRGKTPPAGFIPAQPDADPITGHFPGWLMVGGKPEDKHHLAAWDGLPAALADGTYELCGPKVGTNPERFDALTFIRHGAEVLEDCPRIFDELKAYLSGKDIEGIVWHHPDGRMVKIKGSDFGLKRIG